MKSLFAAALVVVMCGGCGSLDSIDPTSQAFPITFRNDTPHDIHLKLCANATCTGFDYSDKIRAGHSGDENVSDEDVPTRWLVQDDATGKTVGCLFLRFHHKASGVVIRLTGAVACPGTRAVIVN